VVQLLVLAGSMAEMPLTCWW